MPVDAKLMELLVCPKCKVTKLEAVKTAAGEGLRCGPCKLIYPVKDDMPVMLIEEAAKAD